MSMFLLLKVKAEMKDGLHSKVLMGKVIAHCPCLVDIFIPVSPFWIDPQIKSFSMTQIKIHLNAAAVSYAADQSKHFYLYI